MEAEFSDLVGETITSFKQVDCPTGFWGDVEERYEIKTASGKFFLLQTSGGTNIMGFPGSQCHYVTLQKAEVLP